MQFDTERARHEAEEQRLRSEVMRQARDEAEAMVKERTRELEEAQLEIVTRLAVAAEYRDDNTGEHTKRVGRNAAAIAHALGWPEDQVRLLFIASRLHDVGKIGVSDIILHKPSKLEPEEMALMKTHAAIGARILAGGHSSLLKMAEEIARAHHERWDGKGYPLGLSGNAIPLSARIVAVADVLDALTHARPYKRPWPVHEALSEVKRQSGHHFDPCVVEACLRAFGPSSMLSPTDHPADWHRTLQKLREVPFSSELQYPLEPDAAGLVEWLKKLLAEKTQELEVSRREAQKASQLMQEMAFTDPLTGLHNQRAFEADLEAEAARALHHGDQLSVLNLDLDLLKLVNDTQGHERGDALLCAFARTVSRHLQQGKLYRVGGDEFAAILVHTSTEHFAAVHACLKQAMAEVQATGFPGASVSAGIVAFPEEVRVAGDLVRLSDQRMYDDKLMKRRARQHCPASVRHIEVA